MFRIHLVLLAMVAIAFHHRLGTAVETDSRSDVPSKHLVSEADAVELAYSGQVIDKRTRKPIADAKVVVRRKRSNYFDFSIIEETTHQTDADGVYRFTIPPEQAKQTLLYVELDVTHPSYASQLGVGYSLDMIRKNERFGSPPFFKRIELHPATAITGRLIGPDGNPVVGADVQSFSRVDPDKWENNFGAWCRTKSDEYGRFKIDLIKDADSVFWIVPASLSPVQIDSQFQRGDWGDIELHPGVSVSGQILSAAGLPVKGVWVNLMAEGEASTINKLSVASSNGRSDKTDERGGFRLAPVTPGKYRISVDDSPAELKYQNAEYVPIKLDDVFTRVSIELDPVQVNASTTLQAIPHVDFRAQIFGSNGDRKPGYGVHVWGEIDGEGYSTRFHPDHNGLITGRLPRGLRNVRLLVTENEHHAVRIRLNKDSPQRDGNEHEIEDIENDLVDIQIIRYDSPMVLLRPVDEQGAIIKDCQVSAVYSPRANEPQKLTEEISRRLTFAHQQDGRFRSRSVLPDREVTFTVKAVGYREATEKCKLAEGQVHEIDIVLRKLAK